MGGTMWRTMARMPVVHRRRQRDQQHGEIMTPAREQVEPAMDARYSVSSHVATTTPSSRRGNSLGDVLAGCGFCSTRPYLRQPARAFQMTQPIQAKFMM